MRRWWLAILSAIVMFVVLAGAAVVPFENSFRVVAAQMPQQEPTSQLRGLAERLLASPFPTFWFPQKLKVQLLPGQLPTVVPLNLPMPPKGQLVGSAVYRLEEEEEIALVDILLETPGAASDVMNFYRRSLPGIGWQIAPSEPLSPGFSPNKIPADTNLSFCMEKPTEPWFSLYVEVVSPKSMTDAPNNVRINLLTKALKNKQGALISPCDRHPQPERSEKITEANKLLPSLSAPVGVELQLHSSCTGTFSDASISTLAKTNKDAGELEASIARQLEAVGWKRVTGHAEKPLAWSMWHLPAPGNWQGVLLAIQSPQENQYLLSVQIRSQEKFSSP